MAQKHFFDPRIAEQIGLKEAVLFERIAFWIRKYEQQQDRAHFRDGRYWMYCSAREWHEIFPYLSVKQIRSALEKLYAEGMIDKSNRFNHLSADHTNWYTVTDKYADLLRSEETVIAVEIPQSKAPAVTDCRDNSVGAACETIAHDGKSICPAGQKDMLVGANRIDLQGSAIPDISTEITSENIIIDTGSDTLQVRESGDKNAVRFNGIQLILPTKSSGRYIVDDDRLKHLERLYPGVNVPEEMLKMISWLESNPTRRKTARGIPAFIANWLNNAHAKMPVRKNNTAAQAYAAEEDFYARI